jgi:hypothetical protein
MARLDDTGLEKNHDRQHHLALGAAVRPSRHVETGGGERPPPVSSIRPEFGAAFDQVISRAMHPDRGQRYQDVMSLRAALDSVSVLNAGSRSTPAVKAHAELHVVAHGNAGQPQAPIPAVGSIPPSRPPTATAPHSRRLLLLVILAIACVFLTTIAVVAVTDVVSSPEGKETVESAKNKNKKVPAGKLTATPQAQVFQGVRWVGTTPLTLGPANTAWRPRDMNQWKST